MKIPYRSICLLVFIMGFIMPASFLEERDLSLAPADSRVIGLDQDDRPNSGMFITEPAPAVEPMITSGPQTGSLYFGGSKPFDSSVLKDYQGFMYDESGRYWDYIRAAPLGGGSVLGLTVGGVTGDPLMYAPPELHIWGIPGNEGRTLAAAVDIKIGDRLYSFQNARRYVSDSDASYLYLGSVGRQMVEDMAKMSTLSLELTYMDGTKEAFELAAGEYTPLGTWCQHIVKHEIFDCFYPDQLQSADLVHKAVIQ